MSFRPAVAFGIAALLAGGREPVARSASVSSTSSATRSTLRTATTSPRKAPVIVTFDAPGASPRPIRETLRPIASPTAELQAEIRAISYRGLVCGFTFRGKRPGGPVTIRVQGTTPNATFDSGPLAVAWDVTGRQTTAEAASRTGWNFAAAANPNRNGPGFVVSVGGLPPEGSPVPRGATCTLRTVGVQRFAPTNGPVGYWAGFATE